METKRFYLVVGDKEAANALIGVARILAERGAPFRFYAEPGTGATRVLDAATLAHRPDGPMRDDEPRAVILAAEYEPSPTLFAWARFATERGLPTCFLVDVLATGMIASRFPHARIKRLPLLRAEACELAGWMLRDPRWSDTEPVGDESEPHIVRGVD